MKTKPHESRTSLRGKILAFVSALVLLSVLGSTLSLFRITEVSHLLDTMNRVSVPLGRLFTQLQADSDVFVRETDRGLGHSHWSDAHWKPRPSPQWIEEILNDEVTRMATLLRNEQSWGSAESRARWLEWSDSLQLGYGLLREKSRILFQALERQDFNQAGQLYPEWNLALEDWKRKVRDGAADYERGLRRSFALTDSRVSELQTGLEIILCAVVLFSLLLLWLGERALRPLGELTQLARSITARGLRKEDKATFPVISLNRDDEVSQLAREFHRMATSLLERERIVLSQKKKLEESNGLLREMGELNESILKSIDSVLLVSDPNGCITQCNPRAAQWLGSSVDGVLGSEVWKFEKLKPFFPQGISVELSKESRRLSPRELTVDENRVWGGYQMPLRRKEGVGGFILVLQDLTEEFRLQERLHTAENLAAIGRMSAQVAHEVRNPLHSIGLEAEMAQELASHVGNPQLKISIQTILNSVDRLDKITENYLRLSRLSAGKKRTLDLGEILEQVLATYASECQAQGVRIDWTRKTEGELLIHCDPDLLEQALGNLVRNSLQALQEAHTNEPTLKFTLESLKNGRVNLRIEDNGPGIPASVRDRLFTPFFTTKAQGTGLGLSFVKQVVEENGGNIELLDERNRIGACFEIWTPEVMQ